MEEKLYPTDPGTVPHSLQPEIDSSEPEAIAARHCLKACERLEQAIADQQQRLRDIWQEQWECLQTIRALDAELRTNREEVDLLIGQLRDRLRPSKADPGTWDDPVPLASQQGRTR